MKHPALQELNRSMFGLSRSLFQFVVVAPAEKNALRNSASLCSPGQT
jgi:hypothetical protein